MRVYLTILLLFSMGRLLWSSYKYNTFVERFTIIICIIMELVGIYFVWQL